MTAHTKNAIAALDSLRLPELQARYLEVIGTETRCPNRQFLVRKISEALAANDGEASDSAPARITEPAPPLTGEDDEAGGDEGDAGGEDDGEDGEDGYDNGEGENDGAGCLDDRNEDGENCEVLEDDGEARTFATEAKERNLDGQAPEEVAVLDESDLEMVGAPLVEPAQQPAPSTIATQIRGRFRGMTVEELQRTYVEVVGRPSGSVSKPYLVWKIREAEKGRVRVGPIEGRRATGVAVDLKVLPLRIDAGLLERIESAWRSRGLRSRMEFLRLAIGNYLEVLGVQHATEPD